MGGSVSCGQRARREPLEQARRESSQKVLTKTKTSTKTREEEIADIEKQIASGTCSAVALPGMRKRLAALKAGAFRDDRSVKKRVTAADTSISSPRITPSQKFRQTAATNVSNTSKAGKPEVKITKPCHCKADSQRAHLHGISAHLY